MRIYHALTRGTDGRPFRETVWAADAMDARGKLGRAGREILRVEPHTTRRWVRVWQLPTFAEGLLRSISQLGYAKPAQQALDEIVRRETAPWKLSILAPARTALDGGADFVTALRALELYDEPTLTIVGAGERAQHLQEAVDQALDHIRAKAKRSATVRGFVSFLLMEWSTLVSGIAYVRASYLPSVATSGIRTDNAALRVKFETGLAMVTSILDWVNVTMLAATAAGGLILVLRLAYWHRKDHWTARLPRRIPGLRTSLDHDGFSLSLGVCARLLRSGEGVSRAVDFARDVSDTPLVRTYWDEVRRSLEILDPAQAFARSPLDANEKAQLGHAKQMGDLAAACDRVAEQRLEKAKRTRRTTLIVGIGLFALLAAVALGGVAWLLSLQLLAAEEAVRRITRRHA